MAVNGVPTYTSAEPAATDVGLAVRQVGMVFSTAAAQGASAMVVAQAGALYSSAAAAGVVGLAVRQVGLGSATAGSDAVSNPSTLQFLSHGLIWNDTTWERARGNIDGTAMSNATRTGATADGSDIINYNHRGAHLVLNYSTGGTSNLIMMKIQGKDGLTGAYYNVATTVTLSATGSAAYVVYPGITAGAGTLMVSSGAASAVLPRTWRVSVVQSGTSLTANFGVSYSMIL